MNNKFYRLILKVMAFKTIIIFVIIIKIIIFIISIYIKVLDLLKNKLTNEEEKYVWS